MGWVWDGLGWDLCAGLFYEHRFAMLITPRASCPYLICRCGWRLANSCSSSTPSPWPQGPWSCQDLPSPPERPRTSCWRREAGVSVKQQAAAGEGQPQAEGSVRPRALPLRYDQDSLQGEVLQGVCRLHGQVLGVRSQATGGGGEGG